MAKESSRVLFALLASSLVRDRELLFSSGESIVQEANKEPKLRWKKKVTPSLISSSNSRVNYSSVYPQLMAARSAIVRQPYLGQLETLHSG